MDWNIKLVIRFIVFCVEAYVASWIEISTGISSPIGRCVEAYVASWIEINSNLRLMRTPIVEAYVASWIEIEPLL